MAGLLVVVCGGLEDVETDWYSDGVLVGVLERDSVDGGAVGGPVLG